MFGGALKEAWNKASDAGKAAAGNIASGTRTVGAAAKTKTVSTWNTTKDSAASAWNKTKETAASAWGATKDNATFAWGATTDVASSVWGTTKYKAVSAYENVKALFEPKLIGQPIQSCPKSKRERLAEREDLIQSARDRRDDVSDDLLAAADRLELNNKAIERARLAKDVYVADEGGDPPEGWKRYDSAEDLAKLGLTPDMLAPEDSNFRAAVYESEIDGSIVVAFKGTTFTSLEDWKNNFQQGLGGKSDYYERAIEIATRLDAHTDGPVEMTGHSLGGGMAAAGGAVTNSPTYTFNAAAVHPNTLEPYGVTREEGSHVESFYVEGEILDTVQKESVQNAVLAAGMLSPKTAPIAAPLLARNLATGEPLAYDAVGSPHELPAVDENGYTRFSHRFRPVKKHGMDMVINGLEKQKSDDIFTLINTMQ